MLMLKVELIVFHVGARCLNSKYSALDASAGVMMRGVAKCDKHHDQQCSVNQLGL